MSSAKGSVPARRRRPPYRAVSQRNRANKANIALPFSMIKNEEPAKMGRGDWIGLAGLVTLAVAFTIATRELIRIARASEAGRAADRESFEEAGPPPAERAPAPEPAGRASR